MVFHPGGCFGLRGGGDGIWVKKEDVAMKIELEIGTNLRDVLRDMIKSAPRGNRDYNKIPDQGF